MLSTILLIAIGLVQDDWYTFEPGSKNFRVAFPLKPNSTSSHSVTGPTGQMQLTTAQSQTADGVYSVQVTENSARVNPKTLDDGIRKFAASKRATLGPLQTVTVGDSPGREFEMTEGQNRSKWRFVASGSTLYLLSAGGMSGAGVPADADKFLNSLEIGTAKATVAATIPAPPPPPAPKPRPEFAKAEAEAELARTRMEAELARVKAEAELAKVKADAELARVKAEAELARAKEKPKAEFSDTPDASVTIDTSDKGDDDPKDGGKSKSNARIKVTISRIPKSARPYANQDVEDLSRSFASDREGFRDVGPEGSVLVGVRVTYIERFGGPKIRSAQPIYRSGKSYYAGRVYGEVVGPTTTVVARPGYAVGGLVTHTGLTVDGFGIVFMKVDDDRLNPNDSYNSPWLGDRKGGSPGEVMTRGGLVVGLQGKSKNEINALGLSALR